MGCSVQALTMFASEWMTECNNVAVLGIFWRHLKVARNSVFSKSTNLESKLMDFFAFLNFSRQSVLRVFIRSLFVKSGIFQASCQHWHIKNLHPQLKLWPIVLQCTFFNSASKNNPFKNSTCILVF